MVEKVSKFVEKEIIATNEGRRELWTQISFYILLNVEKPCHLSH
jgi:hypothetical protein